MELTVTPPAHVKVPPAKSAGPFPSSCAASAWTVPLVPLPSTDQLDPSHFAMLFATLPPAVSKVPPTWIAGPAPSSNTAIALIVPVTPGTPPNVRSHRGVHDVWFNTSGSGRDEPGARRSATIAFAAGFPEVAPRAVICRLLASDGTSTSRR